MTRQRILCATTAVSVLLAVFAAAGLCAAAELGEAIVKRTGVKAGLCVQVGCGDGRLTAALAGQGRFLVHALALDAESMAAARRLLTDDLRGRASVEHLPIAELPYPENLVNLLVVEDLPAARKAGLSLGEAVRVLVPGGAAYLGGCTQPEQALRDELGALSVRNVQVLKRGAALTVSFYKATPAGMADWPHHDGDVDGRRVSRDRRVAVPRRLKWVNAPTMYMTHYSRPAAWTSAGGRVFYVYDERNPRLTGPKQERINLVARDAYNGLLLWRKPIVLPAKRRRNTPVFPTEAMAADAETLYAPMGENRSLVAMDPATGEILRDYELTPRLIRIHGDALIVASQDLRVFEAATGKLRWKMPAKYCRRILVEKANVYTHEKRFWKNEDGSRGEGFGVGCYDLKTGNERWWTPMEQRLFFVHRGVIIAASKSYRQTLANRTIVALSAETGKVVWTKQITDDTAQQMYAIGDRLWLIDPKVFCFGLDLATGKEAERLSSYHRGAITHHFIRCSGTNATERFLITGNTMDFMEVATGEHTRSRAARSSCQFGVRTANGMVYTFPVDCGCFKSLRGVLGLAPAAPADGRAAGEPVDSAARLIEGPAFAEPVAAKSETASAWPIYRGDIRRSGGTQAAVPKDLSLLWKVDVGADPTAATVAGGLLFVASTQSRRLRALDAATGRPRWTFTPGGPVDTPPTIAGGRCVFGSRDGWIYCLRAADGVLIWRFRAAPRERRIVAFGRLESPTPAWGSVLVIDGVVYATAGRTSELDDGVFVTALDLATGAVRRQQNIAAAPLVKDQKLAKRDLATQGVWGGLLVSDGVAARMRDYSFELTTGKRVKRPATPVVRPGTKGGFLDATMKRPWLLRNRASGQMLVHGERTVCGFGALKKDGWRLDYFTTPGSGQYRVFGKHFDQKGKPAAENPGWEIKACPVAVEAMLIAGDALLFAGPPDVPEPAGGLLWMVSLAEGTKLREIALDAPPVFDGLAAAGGRLYLVDRTGKLLCFGK